MYLSNYSTANEIFDKVVSQHILKLLNLNRKLEFILQQEHKQSSLLLE